MTIILKKTKIKSYLLGLIYIAALVNVVHIGRISLLTLFTALFCVIVILESIANWKIRVSSGHDLIIVVLLLLVISWLSILWSVDKSITIQKNYAYTILPIFFIISQMANFEVEDKEIVKKFIVGGSVIFVFFVCITQGIKGIISGRFALTTEMDQNATCALLFLMFVVEDQRIADKKEQGKSDLFNKVLLVIITWLYFMTGSRGGLIALVAYIFIVYFFSHKRKMRFLLVGILVGMFFYGIAPYILPTNIYDRLFTISSYEMTLNSTKTRVAIWTYCIEEVIPQMEWYGLGTGVPPYIIGGHFGYIYRGIHNTYLAMYMEYGILGLPVFLFFLLKIYKDRKCSRDIRSIAILVSTCIIIFFLESYSRTYFWIILVYITMVSGVKVRNREDKLINDDVKKSINGKTSAVY